MEQLKTVFKTKLEPLGHLDTSYTTLGGQTWRGIKILSVMVLPSADVATHALGGCDEAAMLSASRRVDLTLESKTVLLYSSFHL